MDRANDLAVAVYSARLVIALRGESAEEFEMPRFAGPIPL
jgi:hypothetical protein